MRIIKAIKKTFPPFAPRSDNPGHPFSAGAASAVESPRFEYLARGSTVGIRPVFGILPEEPEEKQDKKFGADKNRSEVNGGQDEDDLLQFVAKPARRGSTDSATTGIVSPRISLSSPRADLCDLTVPALSRDASLISRAFEDRKGAGGGGEPAVAGGEPKLGDWVRVKASVSEPRHHWGRANHSYVGRITAIDGDSCYIVWEHPESIKKPWHGVLSEMEICTPPPPPPGSRAFTELARRLGGGGKQVVRKTSDEKIELRIAAHRAILSSWSPKFRAMFLSPRMRNLPFGAKVTIPVEDPITFREFVRFMYIPLARLSRDNVFSMIRLSHQWRVRELEAQCVRFIQKTLTVREIAKDWELADVRGQKAFHQSCPEFAAKNVRQCHEILTREHLAKVLARDDLGVADETEVFEIVMERVRGLLKDQKEHRQEEGEAEEKAMRRHRQGMMAQVVSLLSALRVGSLPEGYLEDIVLKQRELQGPNGKLESDFMEVLLMSPRRAPLGRKAYPGGLLGFRSATRLGLRFTSVGDIKANMVVRVLSSVPEVARLCNEKPAGATSGAVGFQPSMAKFCGKLVRVKSISVGPAAARIHGYMYPYTCLEQVPAVELEEYQQRLKDRVLREGELVDVLDREDDWLPARVEKIKTDAKSGQLEALVSLVEFPSKWDEWIPVCSHRIAELHEYSRRRGEVLSVVKPMIKRGLLKQQRFSDLSPLLQGYLAFILEHGADARQFWTGEVRKELASAFGIERLQVGDQEWAAVCVHKRLRHLSAMMMDSKGRTRRSQRDASRLNSDDPKWPPACVDVSGLKANSLHEKVLMGQEVSLRRIAQLANARVAARIEHPRFGAAQEVEGAEAKFFAERSHVASGELSEYDNTGIHILPKVLELWDGERDELKLTKGLSGLDTVLMQTLLRTTMIHEVKQARITNAPPFVASGCDDKSVDGLYKIVGYQNMRPAYENASGTRMWFDDAVWRIKAKGYDPKKAVSTSSVSASSCRAKNKFQKGDPCPICYKEMNEEEEALAFCGVKCGGGFHAECIRVWAATREEDNKAVSCPLCRADWSGTSVEFEHAVGFFPPLGRWPGQGAPTLAITAEAGAAAAAEAAAVAMEKETKGEPPLRRRGKEGGGQGEKARKATKRNGLRGESKALPARSNLEDQLKTPVGICERLICGLGKSNNPNSYAALEGPEKVKGTFKELKRMGFTAQMLTTEANLVGCDLDAMTKRLVSAVGAAEEEKASDDEAEESKMTELLPALLRALES
eukprot:jgi/Bigna1/68368/fgenesh1_pg.6_\